MMEVTSEEETKKGSCLRGDPLECTLGSMLSQYHPPRIGPNVGRTPSGQAPGRRQGSLQDYYAG